MTLSDMVAKKYPAKIFTNGSPCPIIYTLCSIQGDEMAYKFKECNREQMYLMPLSLRDWLGEGDIVWFILDAVKQMDLKDFYKKLAITFPKSGRE